MTLLAPTPVPASHRPGPSGRADRRQVLALVDIDAPCEPVLRRATAAAAVLGAPLRVVVLHPRLGFTTDPAVAARIVRRLDAEHREVEALATSVARNRGLDGVEIARAPYAWLPLGDRKLRARRAAARERSRTAARLVVAAEHLHGGGCEGADGSGTR